LVQGKVRLRDDRVQLNCDSLRRYQPESAASEAAVTSQPIEVPIVAVPAESHRLVISITQTSDEDSDVAYLNKLIETLNDFPGQDEVSLCLIDAERKINLKLPNVYTSYCPELHQRLVEMVGEDGLRLEPTNST
jgi:DNA polymerase-3 subunit alpha